MEDNAVAVSMFTDNELNNIIFLCLKYSFGPTLSKFENPENSDIKFLIQKTCTESSTLNIIDTIAQFVIDNSSDKRIQDNLAGFKEHMGYIVNQVMKQPFDIRNDLGDDSGFEEIATIH